MNWFPNAETRIRNAIRDIFSIKWGERKLRYGPLDTVVRRFSTSMKILFSLFLVHGAGSALGCPQQDWSKFSTVSLKTGNAGLLTLTRFTDGIYARVEDEKGIKQMYQLNRGVALYKGLTEAEQKGPSSFFMLDMPIGMALNFLAEQFPEPCAVKAAATPFSYARPFGASTIEVSGSAQRVGESVVVFDLTAVEQGQGGATIKASGKVEFSALKPVPTDTAISDWAIVHGAAAGISGKMVRIVGTIQDLEKLATEEPKK